MYLVGLGFTNFEYVAVGIEPGQTPQTIHLIAITGSLCAKPMALKEMVFFASEIIFCDYPLVETFEFKCIFLQFPAAF
jgi:hypothetical protein